MIIANINEHRYGTDVVNGRHCRDKSVCDRDHLVTGSNTERFECKAQTVGAVADPDGVCGANKGG